MNQNLPILLSKESLMEKIKKKTNFKQYFVNSAIQIEQKCFCLRNSIILLFILDICDITLTRNITINIIPYIKTSKAKCSLDNCCHNCKVFNIFIHVFAIGHTCRPSKNECDLPEFCNDAILSVCYFSYILCDPDRYKSNYALCNSNKGYCYYGDCVNFHKMCQIAYGTTYFSYKCAFYLNKFITKHCKLYGYAQLPNYIKRVCAAKYRFT
ncbi:hypothetical protein HZS_1620 [Henneguya salminicola]|nr:hypothetical protein HZS_1620 [Henneguya salminicola]